MSFDVNRTRMKRVRSLAFGLGFLGLGFAAAFHVPVAHAEPEPPIKSPQDAACRDVARARVFSTPDPQNVGLREIGRGIYMACMNRVTKAGSPRRKARVKRRRR